MAKNPKLPTSRDLQARAMRSRLLEIAVGQMVSVGYDQLSISELCRQAKTSKANFYTHFRSKNEIVAEVLLEVNKRLFARLPALGPRVPRQALLDYTREYLVTIRDQGKPFTKVVLSLILDRVFSAAVVGADRHQALVVGLLPSDWTETDRLRFSRDLQAVIYGEMVDWCLSADPDPVPRGLASVGRFLDTWPGF